MRLAKSLMLAACALLAVVCGCGTEEPEVDQGTVDIVAEPDGNDAAAGSVEEPDGDQDTAGVEADPAANQEPPDVVAEPDRGEETAEAVAVELEEFTNSIGMKFKLIPAGEFMMGSPEDEQGRYDNETQHRVRITEPYYSGVHEVTQGQWEAVMGDLPWKGVRPWPDERKPKLDPN